jgi:hypothetical protein
MNETKIVRICLTSLCTDSSTLLTDWGRRKAFLAPDNKMLNMNENKIVRDEFENICS